MKNLTTIAKTVLCGLIISVSAASAEQTVSEVSWSALADEGKISNGEVVSQDGKTYLKVVNSSPGPTTVKILTLDAPNVGPPAYAIVGQVRCEDVEGKGYLEMWSHFPGLKKFFSRTLGEKGPMKQLNGSSEWRRFVLPFRMVKDKSPRPEKLLVNVVLPGRGTVMVGQLRLVQYSEGEDPLAASGAWWSDRTSGWIGGIIGAVIGCLGGFIGIFGGMGKAGRLVIGAMKVLFIAGLGMLAVAGIALIKSQPFGVWYPFGLAGLLCTILSVALLRPVRRRYEAAEMRKMEAMDVTGK